MRGFILLISFFVTKLALSQVQEKYNYNYDNINYDVVIVQIDTNLLKQSTVIVNNQLTSQQLFDSLKKTGINFLAFNSAPTDANGNLLGLLVQNGKLLQPLNLSSGNGNFFLKPNGLWGIRKKSFNICTSENYTFQNDYIQAVQSGPMLLINRKINPLFDPKSINKNIRLGIGIFSKNSIDYLVIVRSQFPVTFYEFANLFSAKFKCDNAIYLDGGERAILLSSTNDIKSGGGVIVPQLCCLKF